ncbi:MAG: GDYXXLXY domain-containing protein [Gammaproteobacteria bacterium]|nr:GDYXXLXY domain-containing protein [Gammaproteobacteria bacterium]
MKLDPRTTVAIGLTVAILVLFNISIIDREKTISNGKTLFLELAPVDPRSLMQGDYMRLRYVVEDSVPDGVLKDHEKRGYLVLRGDSANVARFVRVHDGESHRQDERLVRFHRQFGRIRIVPDSFFFQEGHGELYEDAQYGMFRFGERDRYLLVGLADTNRVPIEP